MINALILSPLQQLALWLGLTPAAERFAKYTLIGMLTFGADLTLMFFLTAWEGLPSPVAVFLSFSAGISLNYLLSRKYVFRGTERSLHTGYLNMLLAAGIGAFFTTSLTVLAVQWLAVSYLFARVLVAGLVGIGNYAFNLYVNFKVAGRH